MPLSNALSLVTPERGAIAGLTVGLLILAVLLVRAMNWARKWKKAAGLWQGDYNAAVHSRQKTNDRLYAALARAPEFDEDDREYAEAPLVALADLVALSDLNMAGARDMTLEVADEPRVVIEWPGVVVTVRAYVERYEEDEEDWEDEDEEDDPEEVEAEDEGDEEVVEEGIQVAV